MKVWQRGLCSGAEVAKVPVNLLLGQEGVLCSVGRADVEVREEGGECVAGCAHCSRLINDYVHLHCQLQEQACVMVHLANEGQDHNWQRNAQTCSQTIWHLHTQ